MFKVIAVSSGGTASTSRNSGLSLETKTSEVKKVARTATVTFSGGKKIAVPYQAQIDALAAKFPIKDTDVQSHTDYATRFKLQIGL